MIFFKPQKYLNFIRLGRKGRISFYFIWSCSPFMLICFLGSIFFFFFKKTYNASCYSMNDFQPLKKGTMQSKSLQCLQFLWRWLQQFYLILFSCLRKTGKISKDVEMSALNFEVRWLLSSFQNQANLWLSD